MTTGAVGDRLRTILVDQLKYALSAEQIRDGTALYGKGLGLDSLDVVSLVVRLEEEFNIVLEANEFGGALRTFGSLRRTVEAKLGRDGAGGAQRPG